MPGRGPGGEFEDMESAARRLRRRIAEAREEIEAAEPGTDDFLRAYRESSRLEQLYREVRDGEAGPADVSSVLDGAGGRASEETGGLPLDGLSGIPGFGGLGTSEA